MRILSKSTLRDFWDAHADAKEPLSAWHQEAKAAEWKVPADIKARYSGASFVGENCVVFNIKGNTYRLVVKISYSYGIVFIRFIGTHAEYDRIDVKEV